MVHAIRMPKPGQMTEECTLTTWLKHEGDPVAKGDILFEIETDKSAMEVEAFDDGVLLRRLVAEGETVPVNSICAYVGAPGEAIPDGEPVRVAPAPSPTGVLTTAVAEAVNPPTTSAHVAAPLPATAEDVPSPTLRMAISPRATSCASSPRGRTRCTARPSWSWPRSTRSCPS